MAEPLFRTYHPELEIQTRAKGGDGRTIVGIAVPYDRPQWIDPHLTEQFARGAFNAQIRSAARVTFAREHQVLGGTLIGRATVLRDDAAGLYGEWRVSATLVGEETLELVRDGVLDELSIGFREGQNRRLRDGTVERVTAHLTEVAIVREGAYGREAVISGVRSGDAIRETAERLEQARQILAGLPII